MLDNWRRKRKAYNIYRKGTDKSMAGEANEAIVLLTEAIRLNPSNLDTFMNRGISYLDIGEYDKAIEDFTHIIGDKKYKWLAHYNRGGAYMIIREYDLALSDYNKSIELNERYCNSYLERGYIYYKKNNYQKALSDTNNAIQLGCKKQGFNNRAVIYEKMKKYSLAIEDWTKSLKFHPEDAIVLCSRGACYAKTGDTKHAIKDLERGLRYRNYMDEKTLSKFKQILHDLKGE